MEGEPKKIKENPITGCQKEIMVEYIGSKKEMYTGKLMATYTKEKMIANWKELSNLLNCVPGDMGGFKKNQKAKFAGQKKHSEGTGGGPPIHCSSTNGLEAKLLQIITPVAISGNEIITESATFFTMPDVASTSLDVTNILICKEMVNLKKNYKKQKLEILTRNSENKENFYRNQIAAFNVIGNAATNIASALMQIAENVAIIKDRLTT
ncbi:unnamed protein product [Psylliodes chrysocephalus]|uniref:Uncharacterized protein n=1 Tax=Psylliodes chrysocephalus TaxID=3402493 RepID=A0A9P0CXZ6_9CUCU|nr:unnamed protein product [Psylliodes chrysocephala]